MKFPSELRPSGNGVPEGTSETVPPQKVSAQVSQVTRTAIAGLGIEHPVGFEEGIRRKRKPRQTS